MPLTPFRASDFSDGRVSNDKNDYSLCNFCQFLSANAGTEISFAPGYSRSHTLLNMFHTRKSHYVKDKFYARPTLETAALRIFKSTPLEITVLGLILYIHIHGIL
jgi:hypothetical protein